MSQVEIISGPSLNDLYSKLTSPFKTSCSLAAYEQTHSKTAFTPSQKEISCREDKTIAACVSFPFAGRASAQNILNLGGVEGGDEG
ncbi:hypothetical protein V6N11_038502 [Hibiscus sabdariffa]|uniref:Uncharacterized protein n=1 Tax=Hibiscus sabdariffa TaxID=183260 RepID=A0ABR2SL00_9ROSI